MAPTPVLPLLLGSEVVIGPVALLATFLHEPVVVGTIFVMIPYVPVPGVRVVVAVVFRNAGYRQEHGTCK